MPSVTPFQITISPPERGSYAVRASANGAEVRAVLALPDELLRAAPAGVPLARPEELGRALGRALFVPPVRELLLRTAKQIGDKEHYVQIQLRIAAQELAGLPWEWLTLGSARAWSPATREDYTLVRVGRRAQPAEPLLVAGPLHLLIVAARGEELHADALAQALERSVRDGDIVVEVLRNATPPALEQALRRQTVHMLHCAAPVELTRTGTPRLLLGQGIAGFDLARMLADAPGLRLATFTGAQGDGSRTTAAAPALAALALDEDLPAAIAFAGGLPAALAVRFAAACYAQLAEGVPADQAATAGRQALEQSGRGWGLPQIWLVPGGERLFALRGARMRSPGALRAVAGAVGRLRSAAPAVAPPEARRVLRPDAPRSIRQAPLEPRSSYAAMPRRNAHALAAPRAAPPRQSRAARRGRRRVALAGAGLALAAALLIGRALSARGPAPSTLAAIIPAGLLGTPTPVTPTATPPIPAPPRAPDSYLTYETVPGDTLESIADKLDSNVLALADLNHLAPTEPLRAGHPLVIPVYKAGVAQTQGLLVKRGNPDARKVALTFDIEIDQQTFYGFLEILRARGVKGTFFFPGRWVRAYPEAVKAAVREGHELGNHSLTHPFFSRIGPEGAVAELDEEEKLIHDLTGASTRPYFRFPYGDSTAAMLALVGQRGYVAYHWSADDEAIPAWLDRVAQHPAEGNGGILLLHGRPQTVAALSGWLDRLAALGLQPTTLGDVLR